MTIYPTIDDMRIVAAAYRQEMVAGHGDVEAYRAALEAYLAKHPEKSSDTAGQEVGRLIFQAAERGDGWLYGRKG